MVSKVVKARNETTETTTECFAQTEVRFKGRRVDVRCDAPHLSSDGGALLLRSLDDRLGLTAEFAALLDDERDPRKVVHDRLEQMQQRVYQIALGYEDCNDADWLRTDPLLGLACDAEGRELSSQPTLSRFENATSGRELNRLWRAYQQQYVEGLAVDTELVVLDIDSTDDPTHGGQQLSFFHGFYDQYMLQPLLVFDGLSGQLVTALLRPGRVHAAKGARSLLTGLIRKIRARCPDAQIVVRGDSAFAMPKLMTHLEQLHVELGDVDYVFGLARNARLARLPQALRELCAQQYAENKQFMRCFTWVSYAAGSWPSPRAVVAKIEHGSRGENPRFVVTTLSDFPPRLIYDAAYCPRGQAENFIKDFKNALSADRLSCHRFVANAFRLFLHAVAYRLMFALRQEVAQVAPPTLHVGTDKLRLGVAQMDTLRNRLLKVAAEVTRSVRRVLIRLPRSFPLADIFVRLLNRLAAA